MSEDAHEVPCRIMTCREFADETARPDITYALLMAIGGGREGMILARTTPAEPDITFRFDDEGADNVGIPPRA